MGVGGGEGQARGPLGTGPGIWESCEGCWTISMARGRGSVPTCHEALAGIPSRQGMDAEG